MKHFSVPVYPAGAMALAKPRAIASVRVRADSTDPKAVVEALNRAFEEFKVAQDEKLKGKADAVLNEKVERINAAVGDFQKIVDELNAKIAAADMGAGKDAVRDPQYTKAFNAHFRKGDIRDAELNASLNKGTASEGGYFAPVEWDRTVTDRLIQVSAMRQIASVQQISGTTFSKLFNSRGTGSGWVGETAARPETTTPAIGTMNYTTGELYANPSATQQFLDDAEIDAERWLANEVETEFAYQEGLSFVSGNGTNKPNGFLTYATGASNAAAHPWGAILIPVTTGSIAAGVSVDNLIDLVAALPQDYNGEARFVMNRTTTFGLRKLKDTTGQYLWQPSVAAGQPSTLLGFPISEMPAMPTIAANALPIAFGDFRRGYLIVDRMGVRVLRDPYTNKPYVMFYTTKRVGGGLLNPDAIKVLKIAAT